MVKKIFISFFLLLFFTNCNKRTSFNLVRNDDGVVYKNYIEPPFINDTILNLFTPLLMDSFNADLFDLNQVKPKKLEKEFNDFFINHILSSVNEFYSKSELNKAIPLKENLQHQVYACGRLAFQKEIESLLLYVEKPGLYESEKEKSLVLFNIKNNRICSVIFLSESIAGVDDHILINTYFINSYFSQIDFSLSGNIQDLSIYIPEKFISKNLSNAVLYYSLFIIDNTGCLKFINI